MCIRDSVYIKNAYLLVYLALKVNGFISAKSYFFNSGMQGLTEIINLWVTIRGYSIAASWMEVYKGNEKKNVQKSTGLRKSISGTSTA